MLINTAAAAAATATVAHILSLIERWIATKDLRLGRHLHSYLLKTALNHHTVLANRLVHLYSLSGSLPSAVSAFTDLPLKNHHSYNTLLAAFCRDGHLPAARQLFDQMPHRDLVAYNTMISALTHHGHHTEALNLFTRMRKDHFFDKFTVVGVGTACANVGALKSLCQLHGAAIVSGLEFNVIMSNVMIDAYGKCGDAEVSRELFDRMGTRDVISWTSLVVAYASSHRLEEARLTFDRMPERNAVSWTALISGYEQNGEGEAALGLFGRMMEEGVGPTPYTLVSVLSACAGLGLIARGKQVHAFLIRRCHGLDSFNIFTSNCLIDMYAKCGSIERALVVFYKLAEKNIFCWNSVIEGLAIHGHGKEALDMFHMMKAAGQIVPNRVTFVSVLSACAHAGFIVEGRRMFASMIRDYSISPEMEHYGCMVDLLGRAGLLQEALDLLRGMVVEPNAVIWVALLSGCKIYGNLEIAEVAAEKLMVLEPNNSAHYMLLVNMYAEANRWGEVAIVRGMMKDRGVQKRGPGGSWIEMDGVVHEFAASDMFHPSSDEICLLLFGLDGQLKLAGYSPELDLDSL